MRTRDPNLWPMHRPPTGDSEIGPLSVSYRDADDIGPIDRDYSGVMELVCNGGAEHAAARGDVEHLARRTYSRRSIKPWPGFLLPQGT